MLRADLKFVSFIFFLSIDRERRSQQLTSESVVVAGPTLLHMAEVRKRVWVIRSDPSVAEGVLVKIDLHQMRFA